MGSFFSSPQVNTKGVLATEKTSNSGIIITINSTSHWKSYFEASKGSKKLLVIEFTATWCGPCRSMEPTLKEFAARYNKDVEFIKIDVDELKDVAEQFEVHAMPTFLLLKRGKQVDKVVGARKEELREQIEKHRK